MSHRKGQKKQAASPKTAPKNLKPQDEKYAPPHEFGGPIGAALGLVGLPTTIYYLWLCIEYNKGGLLYPSLGMAATNSTNTTEPLPTDPQEPGVWDFLVEKACPNLFSVTFYLGWLLLQALLAVFGTGPIGEGALLSDGESRLKYKFNGLFAWYTTLVLALVLHFTGLLPLYLLADNYGPLLTTASLVATAISVYCYISAHRKGTTLRMSNIFHYDFFMGAELNPRINLKALGFSDSLLEKYKALEQFDLKFFAEIRPGIMLWFLMTLSCLMKQYHEVGFVTLPMMLLCFYHLCYANACYKGEDCIPMSMDIIYEKFGWMLCYANLVWVPFTYCFPALYLVHSATLVEPPNEWCFCMLALHVFGYYIFDTANSQKDYFRARDPEHHVRRGFPQFTTGKLTNPKSIPTEVPGKSLLIDGWWGVARHINYTGDLMMAWAWGLTCAFGSFIPYFYAVYMTILLVHRERRDDYDCRKKYGTIWKKYCSVVQYRFIPGVY